MRASLAKLFMAATALVTISSGAKAEEEKVLNVYNWSDYIAEDTLKRFEQETGIKVNYDVYDDNEVLAAKLMAGKSGYDVVFPSASFLPPQIQAGVYQKLDKSKVPNLSNVDAGALKRLEKYDAGNIHAVPYMTAPTGFAFNVDKIKKLVPDAPTDSWAMLMDPKVLAKLKSCGVTLLDAADEAFPAALAYLGKDPTSQSKEDLQAASKVLNDVRPHLKYIHSSKYINDLANGDICVAHGYGGDLIQARDRAAEAGKGVNIQVVVPKEGAQAVTDVMVIPADAPHPGNAHAFINFILRPDVIGPITEFVGYGNSVKGSEKHVSQARLTDPVVYPPAAVQEKMFMVPAPSKEFLRERNRAWTKIKSRF